MLCGHHLAGHAEQLQGFRTLALEKRSVDVWEVLGAVKTEFGKFGEVLAKTKKSSTNQQPDPTPRRPAPT